MKTTHWNGEFWFENTDPLWKRALLWLCWIGGWHMYWDFRTKPEHRWYRQSAARAGENMLDLLTPISLFGHRLTIFGKSGGGHWWQARLRRGYFVWSGPIHAHETGRLIRPRQIYFAPDATPMQATTWFSEPPPDVRRAVETWRMEREEREEREERRKRMSA